MGGAMPPWRAVQIMRQVLRAVGVQARKASASTTATSSPDNIFLINQSDEHDLSSARLRHLEGAQPRGARPSHEVSDGRRDGHALATWPRSRRWLYGSIAVDRYYVRARRSCPKMLVGARRSKARRTAALVAKVLTAALPLGWAAGAAGSLVRAVLRARRRSRAIDSIRRRHSPRRCRGQSCAPGRGSSFRQGRSSRRRASATAVPRRRTTGASHKRSACSAFTSWPLATAAALLATDEGGCVAGGGGGRGAGVERDATRRARNGGAGADGGRNGGRRRGRRCRTGPRWSSMMRPARTAPVAVTLEVEAGTRCGSSSPSCGAVAMDTGRPRERAKTSLVVPMQRPGEGGAFRPGTGARTSASPTDEDRGEARRRSSPCPLPGPPRQARRRPRWPRRCKDGAGAGATADGRPRGAEGGRPPTRRSGPGAGPVQARRGRRRPPRPTRTGSAAAPTTGHRAVEERRAPANRTGQPAKPVQVALDEPPAACRLGEPAEQRPHDPQSHRDRGLGRGSTPRLSRSLHRGGGAAADPGDAPPLGPRGRAARDGVPPGLLRDGAALRDARRPDAEEVADRAFGVLVWSAATIASGLAPDLATLIARARRRRRRRGELCHARAHDHR